jgi:hypothetical protein
MLKDIMHCTSRPPAQTYPSYNTRKSHQEAAGGLSGLGARQLPLGRARKDCVVLACYGDVYVYERTEVRKGAVIKYPGDFDFRDSE